MRTPDTHGILAREQPLDDFGRHELVAARNAKAAGLSAPYVSEIEGGMKKLAEALKVDLDDLV